MKETLEQLEIKYETLEPLEQGVWLLGGRGDNLLDAWFTLNAQKQSTGFSPVLIGDQNARAAVLKEYEDKIEFPERFTQSILQAAALLSGKDILEQRLKSRFEDGEEGDCTDEVNTLLDEMEASALTIPTESVYFDGFGAIWDFSTQNISESYFLVLIPNLDETTAHAYLQYGDWNDYPKAEENIAILRYWREKYGAVLVALTSDIVELRLERAIQDPHVALDLANEYFAYTSDSVYQGAGSIQALAQAILETNVWSFWWD